MKMRTLAVLLMLLFWAGLSAGESLWGTEGIGLPSYGYDLAARGAGSTAIGVCDPFGMSSVNPALIAWARLPQGTFGYLQENRWTKANGSTSSRRSGSGLSGVRVVLPLPYWLRLGLGYRDAFDGSYQVSQRLNAGGPDALDRSYTGTGGVGELSGTLAVKDPANRLAFGLELGWWGGTLRDLMEDKYDAGVYRSTKDLQRTRLRNGRSVSFGMQVRPLPVVSLGGAWRGRIDYDLESIGTSTSAIEQKTTARLKMPAGFGVGASAMIGSRNRLAMDWNFDPWSQARFHPDPATSTSPKSAAGLSASPALGGFGSFGDTHRIGFGYTRLPGEIVAKDPLLRRSILRAGVSWGGLPYRQKDGALVHEWAVTGGLGLPIQVDRGYLNALLEIGQTGDLAKVGLSEVFLRLGLGLTFGRFETPF